MAFVLINNAVKESLTPEPNGVIVDFDTSVSYKAGTVSIWANGLRVIRGLDNGFTELGGTTVRMDVAPLASDTVQAEYEAL